MDTATAAGMGRKLVLTRRKRWSDSAARTILGALLMMTVTGLAHAQALRVDPSVQFRLTYTDNARAASDARRSSLVGQVTPGLGLATTREGGRIRARLNTRMSGAIRTNDDDRSSGSLGLQGQAQVEAIEDRFFIDFDAAVRRSNLSLFGGRSEDDFLVTDRSNETRTYSVAPRWEFRVGSLAEGRLRYLARRLDSGGNVIGTQRLGRWDANLASPPTAGPLGWGLNYARIETTYGDRAVDDVTQEIARATLSYRVTPQFRVRGTVGHERHDFGGPRVFSQRIVGAGADWFPTPRTAISGTVEDRFFGTGYDLSVSHRRPRSNWLLSYARDVSSSVQQFGSVFLDPFFVALFEDPFFVSQFPDPLEREDAIRQILGLTGDRFVSSAHFVAERLRVAVSLIGARNTLTLSAQRTERSRVSGITGLRVGDEFRDAEGIDTTALTASLSHRLSGASSLNASITHARAQRTGPAADEVTRWLASLGYSKRLSPKAVAGLTYRFQNARGATEFRENVITASLGLRF